MGREGEMSSSTPMRNDVIAPRINLYKIPEEDQIEVRDHTLEVVPLGTDLEVLLINSCRIDAIKVQTIIDDFIAEKKIHNYILPD